MNLVKCEKGHFYDGDKFATCPHCQSVAADVTVDYAEPADSAPAVQAVEQTEPITVPGVAPEEFRSVTIPDEKTVAFHFGDTPVEPVVGWLVCIEGEAVGQGFQLKSGKNFVGRSAGVNDVVIASDMAVSREKHAIVIYDPKSRKFLAQPGMSSELFYVNDEVVLQATALEARDIIQLGKTKLMFIPLCGEAFSWEDYIGEDKEK